MQTKLTLRLDDDVIDKAKKIARKRGKSLSKLVAEYFNHISAKEPESEDELSPIVKSIYGSLHGAGINDNDYKKHLEEKYL